MRFCGKGSPSQHQSSFALASRHLRLLLLLLLQLPAVVDSTRSTGSCMYCYASNDPNMQVREEVLEGLKGFLGCKNMYAISMAQLAVAGPRSHCPVVM